MQAYHASRGQLEVGAVLESRFAGNVYAYQSRVLASAFSEGVAVLKSVLLAEVLRSGGKGDHIRVALREMVTEAVREQYYQDRPSRTTAVFASPSLEAALAFAGVTNQERHHLYLCTIEDSNAFITDADFIRAYDVLAPISEQLGFLTDQAHAYWTAQRSPTPIPEILAQPGSVKITARADWPT